MSKKILGLVVSVALLMVVLSGCFLLPQIDTFTPLVTIVSPASNQTITVPTSTSATNVTVTATVLAHSPIQSVQVSLQQNGSNFGTFNASGALGQNSGSFSYTFQNLPVGSYYLTVNAQSSAKTPGSASQKFTITSSQTTTPVSTKYAAPVISLINVAPNYTVSSTRGYYVSGVPITFSATVTNPNNVGQLYVSAKVNGQTYNPVNNANPYTFTFTPQSTGTYTLYVNATVTIGSSVVSGSNSVVINVPYVKPAVKTGPTVPSRLVMTSTKPASFTFTTTQGVNAYLSINGSTQSTYTSQSPIANSKLIPNEWNTLTLTFKDPWNNVIQTAVATVLGVQAQGAANTTPYLFLIDKTGHVVSNTNDWITVPAGQYLDLYGYIQAAQGQTISNYNITEQYFTNKETTANLTPETSIESLSSINTQIVPLKINAYLFNTLTNSPVFVPFNAYVNGQQVKAFIRYQVSPEIVGPSVSLSVANTYEGVPAAITLTANSNNLQPLTGLVFSAPVNVTPASSWNGYTKPAMTAYGSTTSTTMASRVTYSANALNNLIAPVSSVQTYGANAYGFVTGSKTYYVAFYGPSGTYQLNATVTNIANTVATPSATYLVQADTSAPVANITLSGSYVNVNGEKVYYAPNLKATFNVNDDHAIYWAKLSFATSLQVYYPNNNQIYNYGVRSAMATALVPFNNGVGNYTFWPIATDKHFDAKTYSLTTATTTAIGTGNIVNQATMTVYYDNGSQLSASLIGGQYSAGINTEDYEFVVKASDGSGIGLSSTATVYVRTLSGSLVTVVPASMTPGATQGYYTATFDTYSVPNGFYNVSLGVNDLMYGLLPPTSQAAHTRVVPWGTIQVNNAYPNVTVSNAGAALGATATTINSDIFRINVRDPQLQAWWNGINGSNYQQYFNITLTSSYSNTVITDPMSFFKGITSATGNATTGYILIEIPQIYFNGPTTAPATVQMQVAVYNHPQDDKAIFGQSLVSFVPAPLFTSSQSAFGVSVGESSLTYAASSATYVVVNANGVNPTFPVTIEGLNLSTVSTTTNMSFYFYANGTQIAVVPASSPSPYTVNVPTSERLSTVALSVIYAPSPLRTSASKANILSAPTGYQYSYPIGTLHVLGDVTPVATLSLNGNSINGLSKLLTTPNASAIFTVNAPAFYYHDALTQYATFLGNGFAMNTTLVGNVLVKTFSNPSGTTDSLTLGALTKLASATLAQGNQYVVLTTNNSTPLSFNKAGVYTLTFTPNDPFVPGANSPTATVVVDLVPPALTSIPTTLTPNSSLNATIVTTIPSTITFGATDDAGVKTASVSILDPFNGQTSNLTLTPTTPLGTGTFTDSFSAPVTLPSTYGYSYLNTPFMVTYTVKDLAGNTTTATRLFVTNVDHSPKIVNITAVAANQAVVTLSEPMWANGFKGFTAISNTYGGPIGSTNVMPSTELSNGIAAQFTVTFGYDIWTTSQIGSSVFTDLSNVELSSSVSGYIPIVDLAGNEFTMPINTTTPPVLSVTPTSTVAGKGAKVTFTLSATSAAGIKEIVGGFYGQTDYVYAPTGSMTFTAPIVSGTSTATFTAEDESVNQNKATVTALVYVNTTAPTLTLTAPATVGSTPFTASVLATVGNTSGSNVIKSVALYEGTTRMATATQSSTDSARWTASVTLTGNGAYTLTAVATDLYSNSASTSKSIYIDNMPPALSVTPTSTIVGKGAKVTFTLSATSAAGIEKIVGGFYGQTDTVNAPTGSMTFTAPTTSGTSTATFTAEDESVNQNKATVTALVYVNATAPTLTLTAPATVGSTQFTTTVLATVGNTSGSNVIKSVALYEGTTRMAIATQSSTDSALWTASVTLTGNGVYTLTAVATDLYSNSASTSKSIYVDNMPPVLSVTPTSTVVIKGAKVTFTLSATSTAGIKEIVGGFYGQTDTVNAPTGSMTFTAPTTSGTSTATFTAEDESVNHNKATVTALVYVNATAPTLTLTSPVGSGTQFTISVLATVGNTIGSNVIKSVALYEGTTRMATATQSSTDSARWTASVTLTGNGAYTLTAVATDLYSNSASTSKSIYVDNMPPVLSVTPTSTVVIKGAKVTFTLSATSAAGIKEIVGGFYGQTEYVYAPTGSMTFTAPTTSGTSTATFTAEDESVNRNKTTVTALVYVNATAPTLTLTAPATVGSGTQFTTSVLATVGNTSGSNVIKSVALYEGTTRMAIATQSSTDSALWTASVTLTGNGVYTLTAVATDLYSNSASTSKSIYVDNPTVSVTSAPSSLTVNSIYASVTYKAYDNISGIVGNEATLTITSSGATPVTLFEPATSASSTINVLSDLLANGYEGKSGTALATVTAKSNSGVVKSASTTIPYNFQFEIATVVEKSPGSPIVITFNTVARANSSFKPYDVSFYDALSDSGYSASTITVPNGTTNLATITAFKLLSGGLLSEGTPSIFMVMIYVTNIVGATPTTSGAQVSNSPLMIEK